MLKTRNKKSAVHIKYLTNFGLKRNSPSTMDVRTFVVTKLELACDISFNIMKILSRYHTSSSSA